VRKEQQLYRLPKLYEEEKLANRPKEKEKKRTGEDEKGPQIVGDLIEIGSIAPTRK
jgi:hypothetical protein